MLSYNNKKLLFKSKGSKKMIITTAAVSVLLSFSAGAAIYINKSARANEKSIPAYSNVTVTGSNTYAEGSVSGGSKMDKRFGGIVKEPVKEPVKDPVNDPVNIETPLKDYEVKFEGIFKKDGIKNAFLTFDDGPSKKITPQVLEILDRYNVKASFFIVGKEAEKYPDILKRVYEDGNSINLHSYSHDYPSLYSTPEGFQSDYDKNMAAVKNAIGQDFTTRIYRFPGGSVGGSYGEFKKACKEQLKAKGIFSIDWNALTGDAELIKVNGEKRTRTAPELLERLKQSIAQEGNPEDLVILMHDAAAKQATADVLPQIIEYLKSQGYNFKTMK